MAQFEISDGVAIIPEGTTVIGRGAFQDCTSLKSITIPESVNEIESYAFDGCTSLKSITICEGVVRIAHRAFRGCTSLQSIIIPASVTVLGNENEDEEGCFLFDGCTSLKKYRSGRW